MEPIGLRVTKLVLETVEVREENLWLSCDREDQRALPTRMDSNFKMSKVCYSSDLYLLQLFVALGIYALSLFVRTYARAVHTAQAYAMNDEFSRVLSQQIEYYSNDRNADRINRIKGEMNQVRGVMIENIDKVLDRGERLELLVDKTANMQGNTFRFRKQACRFRSKVWWRNCKLTVLLILLLLVIIYIGVAFLCHGPTLLSCI
ncbi:PREDICTED: vesicle-associated membrane protein 711-like [Camelina sativa]|uniref:Vesicle-associated membrane protein 711-like n=1 Tax=Camelina sativa TaxID=90675 RepID=A0ABM1Q6Y8_CAMSA|nr:PREDICTED: vesicle-associated membrane protein 711-like [Camelina sativa]